MVGSLDPCFENDTIQLRVSAFHLKRGFNLCVTRAELQAHIV